MSTVATVDELHVAASDAKTATDLLLLVGASVAPHGPYFAAELLRPHWSRVTGRKTADRLLDRLVWRIVNLAKVSGESAVATIGTSVMDDSERLAFQELLKSAEPLRLYCFAVGELRRTGWYPTAEDAWAAWTDAKPPRALGRLCVPAKRIPDYVLAVKKVNGRTEIVLIPSRAACVAVTWTLRRQ